LKKTTATTTAKRRRFFHSINFFVVQDSDERKVGRKDGSYFAPQFCFLFLSLFSLFPRGWMDVCNIIDLAHILPRQRGRVDIIGKNRHSFPLSYKSYEIFRKEGEALFPFVLLILDRYLVDFP
jgi:hypothetical protein